MKKTIKRILSIMLVVVMIIGAAPLVSFVGLELPEINLFSTKAEAATYSGKCGDNLTWKYVEATDTLTISGTGSMYDYTGFDRPWEDFSSIIQSVIIGNGVTSIGKWAFSYCDSLESVTIPDSVTIIGWGAFFSCDGLESVAFGNAITNIGEFAFSECMSLENITIPDSVTKISDYAFRLCLSLKNIVIGKGVTSIGTEAFCSCETLASITVDSANTAYSTDEYGVLFNKNKTELIQYPTGNNRTNYIIPDSVISIGDYAFSFCKNLTSITIPNSVISIGKWTFGHCDSLINITIPNNVASIGEQVFYDCDNLTSVIVGNGVTSIGVWSFGNCKKLTSIKLSDNLTSIEYSAFYDCGALESITIPNSVTNIGEYVFYNCDNLKNVYYKGTEEQWGRITIIDNGNNPLNEATIHFFKGVCGDNLTWKFDSDIGELVISGTGEMWDYLYPSVTPWRSYSSSIKSVTISTGVTSICDNAFHSCNSLVSVEIPDSVISIGEGAFYSCDNLVNVSIGKGVTSIGGAAFAECISIKTIEIPNGVTSIGDCLFDGCSMLTTITLPISILNICNGAFYNCISLADVYFAGTEIQWKMVEIGQLNDTLANATIHYTQVNVEPVTVTVNVYSTIDGSVAQFKEYGITISSDDENAPLPNNTYSVTNNLGCVSFPIEFTEDDLEGLSSKTFIYVLTISSANGKRYDFIPETQQVEITITNTNGELLQTVGEDEYRFDGYSYYDYTVTLVWDDHDNVCGVRPESLDLTLVSHLGDVSIPFTLNKDNRWSIVLSVRNVNDNGYFHRYSVEGFDSDVGYEYDVRTYESSNKNGANITATLPICYVSFVTQYGVVPEKQSLIRGSIVTEPEQPADPCYVFVGWYKNEECTEGMKWNFETDKVTQRTTLYAKWDVKLINITLKTEYGILQAGGNSKELVTTIPAGSVVGIKLSEELYDSNNMHIGWVDSEGNEVSSFTKFYEDTTLYAVWQKKPYFNSTVSIKNNTGSKTINYGETLRLTAIVTDKPADAKIYWYIDGAKKGEGETFNVSFGNGTKTVEVKLVDANGNVLKNASGNEIKDSEKVTVNGGFFQKIISFFKNLFGFNRTVVQAIFKSVL